MEKPFYHVSIKMPSDLKQKLEAEAKRQRRSLHNLLLMVLWGYSDTLDDPHAGNGDGGGS